ncbi:hypothetical protein HME9304_01811 [Flagellimonas maritima]|uniref:DNA topoisomerase IV n=1 Tax=Flagellimonas maritima TaxID=1383885 RepID=A0A2Z4LSK3_9FLAO|nr:hypothetical protein [Allomuricauda aurantiaca]AWX44806.1 hypothetical protein HME9304_01811 [Allomuricauda aurantiaca]
MRVLILLLSLMIFSSCSKKPDNCNQFKTGTFKYTDSAYDGYIIERNDSIQIETNELKNIKITCTVKWLSDCEFIVTPIETLNHYEEILNIPINVKIIETENNRFRCKSVSNYNITEVEMEKIK